MNPWTLCTSVQGNVAFMRERFGQDAALRVVLAWDVRQFRDLRGAFPKDVPNPLLGLRSVDLAMQAAAIYCKNGVEVHMLDPQGDRYSATPELSFLIRHLHAQGGLNVSASHNHPDDNGGKFYTELGAQEVPPHDERMVEHVERVDSLPRATWEDALASGLVHFVGPDLHDAYVRDASRVLRGRSRSARIVFTNLHGVGDNTAGEALERAGFELHYVPSQRAHDGSFPGVRFRAPNPEYPTAFEPALELARSVGADLVLGTDPDADRIGAMVPDAGEPGGFRFLSGNELSCLIGAARFAGQPAGRIGIKTEVTTRLFSRIVLAAEGQVVEHLLVGCKYIAGVMRDLETKGRSGHVSGSVDDVLIGTEESHGFLLSKNVRDKDAAAPALVLAELASERKDAGSSVLAALDELYRRHGAVSNAQIPVVMAGAVGRARIEAIQKNLRASPPNVIAGRPVTAFFDRRDEAGVFGPIVSGTDRDSRDVLVFEMGPDHRLVIRPSGTEPKTKIYSEAIVPSGSDVKAALRRASAEAQALAVDFVKQALLSIGIAMPDAGLHCSPLLGVDERLDFGAEILPELLRRAAAGAEQDELRAFLKERTAGWGADGIGMTLPGWQAWRAADGPDSGLSEASLLRLDGAFGRG
jgi:phosphoglucomutase/phosphomannomutase